MEAKKRFESAKKRMEKAAGIEELVAQMEKTIDAIVEANPKQRDLWFSYSLTNSQAELDLNDNAQLTDITPLKSLPLTKLSLAWTGVHDLSALEGMHLRDLDLTATGELIEVGVLAGMPLSRLNLRQCLLPVGEVADARHRGGGQAPPASAEEVHTLLLGFKVIELIGYGGMGSVYTACQTRLKRDVAIKILPFRSAMALTKMEPHLLT